MPNPKRRHSKSRRNMRRAHDAIDAPQTIVCKTCGQPAMPHRMCPSCGHYDGRQIKKIEDEA
ncbi:MAG: 50S ribosomal protein L32 [Acidobacteria bacterium]|nr:50S ribosomal protein L32 [Acidobacteriota bacterium]